VTIGHPISSIEGPATFSSREELRPVGSRVAAGKFGEEAAYKEPNYSLAFTLWNPRENGNRAQGCDIECCPLDCLRVGARELMGRKRSCRSTSSPDVVDIIVFHQPGIEIGLELVERVNGSYPRTRFDRTLRGFPDREMTNHSCWYICPT
jgi:hypothetical protein